MEVEIIDVPVLLDESIQVELRANGSLREMVKPHDLIWQHMSFEHFKSLLKVGMYFKCMSSFSREDERKISEYAGVHAKRYESYCKDNNTNDLQNKLEEKLTHYDDQMFISCWYNSKNLSNVLFGIYAKKLADRAKLNEDEFTKLLSIIDTEKDDPNNSTTAYGLYSEYVNKTKSEFGIAIGTSVENLKSALESAFSKKNEVDVFVDNTKKYELAIEKCLLGNVQYIDHEILINRSIFDESCIFVPPFIKETQFSLDSETRVCIRVSNDNSSPDEDEKEKHFTLKLDQEYLLKLIRYIAVEDNNDNKKNNLNKVIKNVFCDNYNLNELKLENQLNESGFTVFEIKKEGD